MSKEFSNRHDRDELDIESLILSLRQDGGPPAPKAEPVYPEEPAYEAEPVYPEEPAYEAEPVYPEEPVYAEEPEYREAPAPRKSFRTKLLSFFRRKEEPQEEPWEAPDQPEIYEEIPEAEEPQSLYVPDYAPHGPQPEEEPYSPEEFTPLPEQVPDIVLHQMEEAERKEKLLRQLQSGQVVELDLRSKKQPVREEPPAAGSDTKPIRLEETRVAPPEPISVAEKEVPQVPPQPSDGEARIFTLHLRGRSLEDTPADRARVFDQAQETEDEQLETLERMLAKHALESRRRREAEAEAARLAQEEAQRRAEEEAARLAAQPEGEEPPQEPSPGEMPRQEENVPAEETEEAPLSTAELIGRLAERKLAEKYAPQEDPDPAEEEKTDEEPDGEEAEDDELADDPFGGRQVGAGLVDKVASSLFGKGKKDELDQASDADFQSVRPKGLLSGLFARKQPLRQEGNVIRMPEPEKPNALQKKLEEMDERADEFAEGMFRSDSPEAKAAEKANRLAEQYIPATDEVADPVRPQKQREEKAPEHRAPDTSPKELYRIYLSSWRSTLTRLPIQFVLAALLLLLSAAAGGELPVEIPGLTGEPKRAALILTIGLGVASALALDTLLEGIVQLFRRRPGLNVLASFGTIFTLVDSIWYLLVGREGPLPLCGFAALGLWAVAWGSSKKKNAVQQAASAVAGRSEFERLTMDQGKLAGWGTFIKEPGSTRGFGSQMQEEDGMQRICRYAAPALLLACLALGILSVVGQKAPTMLIWSWSVIFVLATPLSATLAYGMPYLISTVRLKRNGAILAGWQGAESMEGEAGIILKDRDLFPEGNVNITGVRNIGDISLEKLTGCTASMIREADVGLSRIFDDQVRTRGGFYRRVDELKYSDAGGYTGLIRGDKVLIGTAGFMKMQGIELEQGQHAKNAVFCAINGRLQGIFALNYSLPRNAEASLDALIRGHVYPVLALRDFNVTPTMLQQRFRLPVDRMQYPPVEKRHQLSARNQPHTPVLGALIFREGIGPYAEAVLGGRRLCGVVRLNTLLAILSSVIGAFMGFYLTMVSAYASLSPMNILFFLVMWLIPTLLISRAADKF